MNRRILSTLLLSSLVLSGVHAHAARQEGAPAASPNPNTGQVVIELAGEEIRARFDAATRTPERISEAKDALEAIAKAYREAKALTDTMSFTIDANGAKQEERFAIAFGAGTDARLAIAGATMVAAGGQVTVVPDVPATKALRVPLEGDLMTTLRKALPGFQTPVTLFDLRAGRPLTLEALGMNALLEPRLAGLRQDAAEAMSYLLVEGTNGASEIGFSATTKLLTTSELAFTPPDAPPGFRFRVSVRHENQLSETLAAPIEADTTGRTIVATIDELLPTREMIRVGESVPAWSGRLADGTVVSQESLKGSVVVLSFWATWCAPCKRTLPYVDEFARWAASEGLAVRVFGVNTLESGDGETRVQEANGWWGGQKFQMPLLLDLEDSIADALGVRVLPTTILIGPDGVVRAIQQSIDPQQPGRIVEDLKGTAKTLLGKGS
jgi:thiol-disulfide isomerase/thioredoxin